ncbi:MAG: methylenetetrahydrofolate reductase [Hyphomicrobiales bacterium]|nr:methylenetetrahydrofolate reductase [Hyphomicrobiales bacterium]
MSVARASALLDKEAASASTPREAIAALAQGFSLEATRPSGADIDAIAQAAPAGTRVYLSAVPMRPPHEVVAPAAALRAAGLEPVPHLAVRNFESARALDELLARLCGEAGVRRALVIAGDRAPPAGRLHGAIDIIDRGTLARHGLVEIGIAGYPDGHPRIATPELERALAAKLAAAAEIGVAVHIVTQLCFDAGTIRGFVEGLRARGIDVPVRIGLVGPTTLPNLWRYAQRCGVRASAQGLVRQAGLARQLFTLSAPDGIIRALAQARSPLGDVALHYFSFGAIARSARWAAAVAKGQVTLAAGEGFELTPP